MIITFFIDEKQALSFIFLLLRLFFFLLLVAEFSSSPLSSPLPAHLAASKIQTAAPATVAAIATVAASTINCAEVASLLWILLWSASVSSAVAYYYYVIAIAILTPRRNGLYFGTKMPAVLESWRQLRSIGIVLAAAIAVLFVLVQVIVIVHY